ncbi:MAG: hypothetical protein JST86_20890 [Bacteroidetes bacterium]|nr:hypothetical protein [Bacteroidota bacterium]
MKKSILLLLLLSLQYGVTNAQAGVTTPKISDDSLLTFKVKLVEATSVPGCGMMAIAAGLKCTVIPDIKSSLFISSDIIIMLPCPEAYGQGFLIPGQLYYVSVTKRKLYGYVDHNKFELEHHYPTYYCLYIRQVL